MECLPSQTCEGMHHMSESVFVGLCDKLGTSQDLIIRRETTDIRDMLTRQTTRIYQFIETMSGSRREGFRLEGSDVDSMYCSNYHRVIMDMSQSEYYNTANTTLILSDSTESPPGFTLLQLLTPTRNSVVQSACVRMNDRICISSSLWVQLTCSLAKHGSIVHGPCGSGVTEGKEYDDAYCFVCDFWPPSASSWIDRCHSWPDPEVVNDIIRNGCHFVAIGHPFGSYENEEWRISFSQAEYKLVYSMNHSQFLTYGLLKLFLKEVINQQSEETSKLLCSYHMKTTVFWAIQQTLPHWCPQNLLAGFWVCFKLLLQWVYKGICPNFFIPQNNLFLTKVHGSAQYILFLQLNELYKKGLTCLLQSSSIRSYIIDVLYNPRLSICTDESIMRSEVEHDKELVMESSYQDNPAFYRDLCQTINIVNIVEQLVESPLSHFQVAVLQKITVCNLQSIAFFLQDMFSNKSANKQMYIADKQYCHMLKLAAKLGRVSDRLFIAMYYYKTLRYREALYVLKKTKVKLTKPYVMYRGRVDKEMYTEAVGGQSWSTKLREAVIWDIKVFNSVCYINELIPEQWSSQYGKKSEVFIQVSVMLHFLEFLCYRHIDTTLSQAALDELQVEVHHDRGCVCHPYLDISWEILGICQQIAGDLQAALYSYQQSLAQDPYNHLHLATEMRIQDKIQSTQDQ